MRQLNEVEPEVEVVVKKIDGSSEVKAHLDELGISEGSELTVVATEPVHLHVGPISLRAGGVAGKESVVARGWADKVYVEKAGDGAGAGETVPLLRLEAGEKGTVKSIEGGKGFEEWFSELGVEKGGEVEFLQHLADDTLVVTTDGEGEGGEGEGGEGEGGEGEGGEGDRGQEVKMGEGQASKVLVEREGQEGQSVQMNFLAEGEKARVSKVLGGSSLEQKFKQNGIEEGNEVRLLRKEASAPTPKRGSYVLAKISGQLVTVGRGLAEKVWVE